MRRLLLLLPLLLLACPDEAPAPPPPAVAPAPDPSKGLAQPKDLPKFDLGQLNDPALQKTQQHGNSLDGGTLFDRPAADCGAPQDTGCKK